MGKDAMAIRQFWWFSFPRHDGAIRTTTANSAWKAMFNIRHTSQTGTDGRRKTDFSLKLSPNKRSLSFPSHLIRFSPTFPQRRTNGKRYRNGTDEWICLRVNSFFWENCFPSLLLNVARLRKTCGSVLKFRYEMFSSCKCKTDFRELGKEKLFKELLGGKCIWQRCRWCSSKRKMASLPYGNRRQMCYKMSTCVRNRITYKGNFVWTSKVHSLNLYLSWIFN